MSDYVENDFAGKLLGVNTFTLRRFNEFTPDDDNQDWRAMQRRPRIYTPEVEAVREVLPPGMPGAVTNETFL
jgi:putative ABC transport system permease protein